MDNLFKDEQGRIQWRSKGRVAETRSVPGHHDIFSVLGEDDSYFSYLWVGNIFQFEVGQHMST